MNVIYLLFLGLLAGTLSGLLGIGGAIIIIPALVYLFGFSQHGAQGTTLAIMIPPIGLLAALKYYFNGHIHIPTAVYVAVGFFIGGLIGATIVGHIPDLTLKRVFGVLLLILSVRMMLGK